MEMRSTIDDPALLERIGALSHGTPDPTGNWIGGGRPHTNLDIPVGPLRTSSKAFARWSAVHYAFYAELIGMDPDPPDNALVLDLGCAGGARTMQLSHHYQTVFGVDRDRACIDFAFEFNDLDEGDFFHQGWPHKEPVRYDRIFAVEFFEHFKPGDQVVAIRAAIDALAPGGMLFLTMPNEKPGEPPHEGTRETASFSEMILTAVGGNRRSRVDLGTLDNAAPGDPTDLGWRPVGPRASHNYAVVSVPP